MKQKDADREYRKFLENWLPKFTERCTIFLHNLKDRKAVKEDDWEVIKTAFRSYYMGYCPDFVPVWQPPQEKFKQIGIFENMTENTQKTQESDKSAEEVAKKDFGEEFALEILEPTILIEDDTDKET